MQALIEKIAGISGIPVDMIKGRKRHSREVSYAKMIFCRIAYDSLRIRHREIACFLGCSRESVYYLLKAADLWLEYDREFREMMCLIL